MNFLDQLKKDEDTENQKPETKIEYSYQIKDDKKVTSTPLIEFLSAKKEEKRDAKVREETFVCSIAQFVFISLLEKET